jgi:hypothetical protein
MEGILRGVYKQGISDVSEMLEMELARLSFFIQTPFAVLLF